MEFQSKLDVLVTSDINALITVPLYYIFRGGEWLTNFGFSKTCLIGFPSQLSLWGHSCPFQMLLSGDYILAVAFPNRGIEMQN